MPRLIFSANALRDLKRLQNFWRPKSHDVAERIKKTIFKELNILTQQPRIGRRVKNHLNAELREWLISFGASGYVALYRFYEETDLIVIPALRHQKEVGYHTAKTS